MNLHSVQEITVVAGGGTSSVLVDGDIGLVHIDSAAPITLAAAHTISASGTAKKGMYIKFLHGGTFTTDTATGKHLSVFGYVVPDEHALYEATITAYYNGSAWEVRVCPSQEGVKNTDGSTIIDDSIPTDAYAPNSVDNAALTAMAGGNLKIGVDGSNVVDLDGSGDAKILIGDGTTMNSVDVSGAITIDNTGAATIPNGYVTNDMLAETPATYLETVVILTSAELLALNSTPIQLLPAGGAGVAIEVISVNASMPYVSSAYVGGGTLQVYYNGFSGNPIATSPTTSLTGTANTFSMFTPVPGVITGGGNNDAVYITNATADFTAGDSTLRLNILYRKYSF